MGLHRGEDQQHDDASSSPLYEPPRLTELGSFREVTAGPGPSGRADYLGKTPYRNR